MIGCFNMTHDHDWILSLGKRTENQEYHITLMDKSKNMPMTLHRKKLWLSSRGDVSLYRIAKRLKRDRHCLILLAAPYQSPIHETLEECLCAWEGHNRNEEPEYRITCSEKWWKYVQNRLLVCLVLVVSTLEKKEEKLLAASLARIFRDCR